MITTEWAQILEAECERRDRADAKARERAHARAARQHEPVTTEWHAMAYAQFLAAERDLVGNLAVTDAPFADAFSLWSGTEAWAQRWATEELKNWWRDVSPRITVTAYRGQVRAHREAYRNEQLDQDEPGRVRDGQAPGSGSSTDPADRCPRRAEPGSEAANYRPAGPAEADPRHVTVPGNITYCLACDGECWAPAFGCRCRREAR